MNDATLTLSSVAEGVAPASAPTWQYRAFGLNILSEIALPELQPGSGERIDLEILRRPTAPDFPLPDAPTSYDWSPSRQVLLWPSVGRFTIDQVQRVIVEAAPGVEDRLLAFPLLGPVMALVKHLQGCLVLHGSGIAVNGQGVAFLGDKMAGKSTLASAFVARGHALLSDDVIAIPGLDRGRAEIEPAFPLIKLSSAAGGLLSATGSEAWPEVMPNFPKRVHRLAQQAMPAGIPPGGLFVLARGREARIDRLSPAAVFGALMHNSYLKKFIGQTLTREAGARHLGQIAALAEIALVARLQVPDSIDRLSEAVDLVERTMAERMAAPPRETTA